MRLRRLINRGFSPRMILGHGPRVRQVVTEVLDSIAARGPCDFVADIAVAVPMVVIAELDGRPDRGPGTAGVVVGPHDGR